MKTPQQTLDQINADAERRQRERQAEYAALAQISGRPLDARTIIQIDVDLTNPDPRHADPALGIAQALYDRRIDPATGAARIRELAQSAVAIWVLGDDGDDPVIDLGDENYVPY